MPTTTIAQGDTCPPDICPPTYAHLIFAHRTFAHRHLITENFQPEICPPEISRPQFPTTFTHRPSSMYSGQIWQRHLSTDVCSQTFTYLMASPEAITLCADLHYFLSHYFDTKNFSKKTFFPFSYLELIHVKDNAKLYNFCFYRISIFGCFGCLTGL